MRFLSVFPSHSILLQLPGFIGPQISRNDLVYDHSFSVLPNNGLELQQRAVTRSSVLAEQETRLTIEATGLSELTDQTMVRLW